MELGKPKLNRAAFACTRVFWIANQKARVSGRTMDLLIDDDPRRVLSPRGMDRDGQTGTNSLKWKSKYGSVVLTAFGAAVDDGINEHGLAAHLINLPGTEYEVRDNRPGIGTFFVFKFSWITAEPLERTLLLSMGSKWFPSSSVAKHGPTAHRFGG